MSSDQVNMFIIIIVPASCEIYGMSNFLQAERQALLKFTVSCVACMMIILCVTVLLELMQETQG